MTAAPSIVVRIETAGGRLGFDLGCGTGIAVDLEPGGAHPRFFTDQPATAEPLADGGFAGTVAAGASCNAGWVRFAPHCHGTHTEGPGHLMHKPEPVQAHAPRGLLVSRLVTVEPATGGRETAPPGAAGGVIESAMLPHDPDVSAMIIRTLPNPQSKCRRDYGRQPDYPVLSVEATQRLVAAGIEHLLIDTPSLDPAADGGALVNHRTFWMIRDGRPDPSRTACTITEMIYAPDALDDGVYLLHLGISPILGEASPSAPVLFAPAGDSGP